MEFGHTAPISRLPTVKLVSVEGYNEWADGGMGRQIKGYRKVQRHSAKAQVSALALAQEAKKVSPLKLNQVKEIAQLSTATIYRLVFRERLPNG